MRKSTVLGVIGVLWGGAMIVRGLASGVALRITPQSLFVRTGLVPTFAARTTSCTPRSRVSGVGFLVSFGMCGVSAGV
jgi:hypothetical protein